MTDEHAIRQLVLAFFENLAAGNVAARVLEEQAIGSPCTIGLLALDPKGKIQVELMGARRSFRPGVKDVLGVIALAISGGVMPVQTPLFDAKSDVSTDDVARIGAELEGGHAAVAILGTSIEAEQAVLQLTRLGGKTELHKMTPEGMRLAASAPTIDPA